MKLGVLELASIFGDVAANLEQVEAVLGAPHAPVDLVLLPEASLTGYVSAEGNYDLSSFAEPSDGPTATALAALAKTYGVALAGPLIEKSSERCFNSLLLFDAGGRPVGHWRKRHPWYPERWATPGDLATSVVDLGGTKLCGAICFDIHSLGEDAPKSLATADVLLFPSAWVEDPVSPADTRLPILRALARRFDLAIANANWGRAPPLTRGQGGSAIIDATGSIVAAVSGAQPTLVVADLPTSHN